MYKLDVVKQKQLLVVKRNVGYLLTLMMEKAIV